MWIDVAESGPYVLMAERAGYQDYVAAVVM